MMKHRAHIGVTTAIAAALALSSTPLLAQEAQPVPTNPAPTTTTTEPAPETQPVTTDTTSEPAPTSDSATTAMTTRSTTATRRTRVTAAKPKPVAATTTAVTHRTVRTAAPAPAAAPVAARPAPAAPAPAKPTPVVNTAAKPAAVAPPAQPAQAPLGQNDTAFEIGGGALALLALGGAAFAFSRRRRHAEEEEWYGEEAMEQHDEPMAEPIAAQEPVTHADTAWARHEPEVMAATAPSAFAWDKRQQPAKAGDDGSDRRPGESWVERAYRGPSPANPSASLKYRLRRAAFFDKRERDVAAGKAEPVDADAGLPEAATELETA